MTNSCRSHARAAGRKKKRAFTLSYLDIFCELVFHERHDERRVSRKVDCHGFLVYAYHFNRAETLPSSQCTQASYRHASLKSVVNANRSINHILYLLCGEGLRPHLRVLDKVIAHRAAVGADAPAVCGEVATADKALKAMGKDSFLPVHPTADARSGSAFAHGFTRPAACAPVRVLCRDGKTVAREHADITRVGVGDGDRMGVLGVDKMANHGKISFHSPGSLSLWLYLIIPQNRAFVKGFLKNFFNFFVHNLFTKSLQFREPDK